MVKNECVRDDILVFWILLSLCVWGISPVNGATRAYPTKAKYRNSHSCPTCQWLFVHIMKRSEIQGKLENTLALDYQPEQLQIIVVSDDSTDGTNEIVKRFSSKGD